MNGEEPQDEMKLELMPPTPGVPEKLNPDDYFKRLNDKLEYLIKLVKENNIVADENLAIPPEAYEILREVLLLGANKGHDKWWQLTVDHHLEHAGDHIAAWNVNKKSKHLNHAFTRLMFCAVIQHRENVSWKESKDV